MGDGTFSAPTDQENKVSVDSDIVLVQWKTYVARSGTIAAFEVITSYVGEGAPVEVTLFNQDKKKFGKVKGEISRDRFHGEILIPESVSEAGSAYLEVKLSKHGLSDSSNVIELAPMVIAESMEWNKTTVHRGAQIKMSASFSQGIVDGEPVEFHVWRYDDGGIHHHLKSFITEVANGKAEVLWDYNYTRDVQEIPTEAERKRYEKSYQWPQLFYTVDCNGAVVGKAQESGFAQFNEIFSARVNDTFGMPLKNQKINLRLPNQELRTIIADTSYFCCSNFII